jgi:hypothetical protein
MAGEASDASPVNAGGTGADGAGADWDVEPEIEVSPGVVEADHPVDPELPAGPGELGEENGLEEYRGPDGDDAAAESEEPVGGDEPGVTEDPEPAPPDDVDETGSKDGDSDRVEEAKERGRVIGRKKPEPESPDQ